MTNPVRFIGLPLAGLVGFRCADFLHRLSSSDPVALAFAEGGDDGYYFFTVARNIAGGHGITIDQVHWTTGFQPLWELVCALAWLATSNDRTAFGLLYLASLACWLASAFLLVRLVRAGRRGTLSPVAAALIAALLLCEGQLSRHFFNGMETGLYLTLCLATLVAFQRHLQTGASLVALGVLGGLMMLARNDGVFLFAALLGALVLSRTRPQPLREAMVIGLVASVLVVPWLIYCQAVSGSPMPQSGIATSVSLRGHVGLLSLLANVTMSLTPLLVLKARTLVDSHAPVIAILMLAAAAAALIYWQRDREAHIDRGTRWVIWALAAACIMLLAYYALFSAAGQFFERYFAPLKLLALILLSLLIARLADRFRPQASALAALAVLAFVGSHAYWIWRDFNLPYRSYLGEEAYAIVRSPYAKGTSRIGMTESGRIGFLYPTRVVNLDGKMRVDALHALRSRTIDRFVASAELDDLLLQDADIAFFDRLSPGWRQAYERTGTLGIFTVLSKRR